MPENKDVAIRKRQQIDSSKKTMFLFNWGVVLPRAADFVSWRSGTREARHHQYTGE